MTAREFLGDDNIRKLEGLGFSPLAIRDLAKKEYETKKQSLIDRGINEGVAAQGAYENMSDHEIEQMNDDANRGWIRRGWDDTKKAVLETANAYSKFNDYGKDVENYLNKKISGDEKAKFERKTKSSLSEYADKEIKRIDKADERWAQAHPDEWNVAGFAGGLVGGFIDPINLIPLAGSAKWGKKVLYYAGTGAAAGGVSAYGGDRNVGEGVVTGAVGGAILGPLMEYGVSGISKLITKRRASRAANEADAVSQAENSDFLRATDDLGGSEIKVANGKQAKVANRQDGDIPPGGGAGGVKTAQTDDIAQTMTAREFATGEAGLDEATAAKVVKEAAQGKEKSDFVDADTYADIVKFKDFENQRDYAKAYGEQIEAAKQSLESAREQSAVRYADTQRAINEYQKQGMSASATRELINAKFKPSADEINYTRAYNGGADVDPRLAGQGIFYAIEKDIAAQAYTPEIYAARLKQRGFSDESAQAFTQAYIQKDINIAKDWANGKAAEVYENNIRAQVASEIKAKNEAEGEGWTMRDGGAAKTDYTVKTDLAPNVRDLSKITTDEISADLEYLAGKHPEIFDKPSDVFRLVKDIKENPTHFFTNNRLDYALIVKRLKNNKIGKLAIDKQSGEVKHATKVKDKDLKRLAKVSEEKSGNAGIIQTFTRPGSKLENQGLGYQDKSIISQKGNLVNEKEANGLRDSVSSVGDNASRAGGRQAGDEQILRQGRRDTTNASQTKRPAQSDEQMEQQWAAKADGEADAAAATKQVVEKQGGGNNEVAHRFTIDDAINAKLNFINENNLGKEGWLDKLNAVIKKYDLKEAETKNEFMGVMIRDRFKYGREFNFPSMKDVMPKISPLKPQYHEILNGAHKELNEILKNKTIPATREQNLKFHAANSNVHLGSGLVAGTLNSIDEDGNFSPERFAAGFLAGLLGGKAIATGLRKMTPKLYNQILGAAEKMPQMANGNPRLLGKLYSNGKDISLNSFAGEKAITANVGKLDQAKAMLEKGADEVEIWQKTGWFKDKDEAWKFEIGDSNARLNPGFQSGGRLGELLDHEELFKAYPELKDVRVVKIGDEIPGGAALSVKDAAQREKRGIYNVTYNDKTATLVRQDLKNIDDALRYAKGDKSEGAKHIGIRHMKDESAEGYVTKNELLNMGERIREYLAKYKEPFIDEKGGHIYEWQNERGERFRAVIGKIKREQDVPAITSTLSPADEAAKKGLSPNSSLYSHNEIITFYSDRNLKDRMDFKNPKVKYDVNLSEWHKDSAPITKNADGSPKVFYHGSSAKDITEFKSEFDNSGIGFWFADKDYAANHGEGNLYETFLRIKNPLDLREENAKYPFELMREMQRKGLSLEPYGKTSKEAKEFLKQNGYDGIVLDGDYKERPFVIAFDSAQIKHVKNDGSFSDSPNIYKSGAEGYYDPARNEIGLRDLGDKSTLMHEVQHAIQEIEDFARGGNMAEARSYLRGEEGQKYEQELKGIDKTLSNLSLEAQHMRMRYSEIPQDVREYEDAKELFRAIENREKAYAELSVLRDDLYKKLFEIDKKIRLQDIRETYRKIHGEAEARNVESRLNLDGKAHPHETFDVNPNETIVSKDGEVSYSRKVEEIKREHPNVEKELDESIAAMRKESFNDSNFKNSLLKTIDDFIAETKGHPASGDLARPRSLVTQELGKSVNLSDKQLAVLKNDIKNADFKVINESKIYFDKIGKNGDKKRFFVDIAQDGNLRVDAYAKSQIDNIPVKQSALEELADTGDAARLKNMSFEIKAAYRNELDPIKKEAILKTAELNKLKKAAQSGDKAAVAKFEEFKAKNLDENGNIKDGLSLC